jgi:hypothetical protein
VVGGRDGSLRPCSRISRPEPLLVLQSSSSIVLNEAEWSPGFAVHRTGSLQLEKDMLFSILFPALKKEAAGCSDLTFQTIGDLQLDR